MKRHILLISCLIGISACYVGSSTAQAEPSSSKPLFRGPMPKTSVLVIIYMAARNDLAVYAETHISQLLNLGSTDRVKIFVHLDLQKPDEPLLSRNFFVEKDKLLRVGNDEPTDSGKKDTLIQAATMAYEQFPADEVALVLWNHGTGPIEPKVAPAINQWELWRVDSVTGKIDLDQSIGYLDRFSPGETSFDGTKGICFDDVTGSYLKTHELVQAIEHISKNVIKKKFKIVACDACLMAGIDVFSGLQPYVDYYVASQEVELGLGYKYDLIVEPLIKDEICCGEELACHFVSAFKKYYSPKIDFYTHVALDLSYCEKLDLNIEKLSQCLSFGLEHQDQKSVKEAIRLSRHKKYCIHFNEPTYIDLGNFYKNLLTHLGSCTLKNGETKAFRSLLFETIHEGIGLIRDAVKANEVGSKHEHASGISIYFPEYMIHKSYRSNYFAQKTLWLSFLEKYIASH